MRDVSERLKPNATSKEIARVPDQLLTLTKIENTTIVCRVCRGQKIAVVKFSTGRLQYVSCPACHGSGTMPSKLLWRRE